MSTSSLVVLYPGAISFEVMLAIELLGSVDVATSDGCNHVDGSGLTIAPTVGLDAAAAVRYNTVLVPGGNPDGIVGDPTIRSLLTGAVDRGATVGGICAGVVVLADAGILASRRITHNYGPDDAPAEVVAATKHLWRETIVTDGGCTVDQRSPGATIVTAKPWAFIEFAIEVALAAGRFDRTEANDRLRYYRGMRH